MQVSQVQMELSGVKTGVLDIQLRDRRVISLPSQLGCRVGCAFCVSSATPLIRNLRAWEMVELVEHALGVREASGAPIELSFSGEGESLLNLRETEAAALELAARHRSIKSTRYSFSGLGAPKLLSQIPNNPLPARLQFSLHAARPAVRSRLIPRSAPLEDIRRAMHQTAHRFSSIELNVVLLDGVNDSDEDLAALARWGDAAWPILLNPRLNDGDASVGRRADEFEQRLQEAGRTVKRYTAVAASIGAQGFYPGLTAQPLPPMRSTIPIIPATKVDQTPKQHRQLRL